jgi:predicted ATPase with chaperone activity
LPDFGDGLKTRNHSEPSSRGPVGPFGPCRSASGLPAFFMVGLPETAVRESKERVRSALLTAGFSFPPGRITVKGLSARAYHRLLKLARTCADLAHAPDIGTNHVSEAVKLRALDRVIC